MLVNVEYGYSVREWGEAALEVEDEKDEFEIEGHIRDMLEDQFGKEAIIADITIDQVKEIKTNHE